MCQLINVGNFKFNPQGSQNFAIPTLWVKISKGIQSKRDLLAAFHDSLKFPYFGWNWDALQDCLRDLSWIGERHIVIDHDGLPSLSKSDLQIYLSILSDTVEDWAGDVSKNLEVVFPPPVEAEIRKLVREGAEQAKN